MSLLRRLAAILLLAVAAAGPASAREPLRHADYFVMRHLQKGEGADPGLTPQGRAAAQRLVAMLAPHPPKAIYVSKTLRARETAAAVAARWKLVPKEYDPSDTAGLIARVRAERGPVLIVGHSNTVPDIVERLGGRRPPPLGDVEYGDIWCITRANGQTTQYAIGNGELLIDAGR
jgi:broad specificity phosphatase PhoE